MRLPVTITNVNNHGRTTNKWYVRVGGRPLVPPGWFFSGPAFRPFTEQDWVNEGMTWVKGKLTGGTNK